MTLATTLVLVPDVRMGCRLHLYEPGQRLRSMGAALHPAELVRSLRACSRDGPPLVVLAGQPRHEHWLQCALESANVVIVPAAWLRQHPRRAHAARARAALTLVRLHFEHPLRDLRTLALDF